MYHIRWFEGEVAPPKLEDILIETQNEDEDFEGKPDSNSTSSIQCSDSGSDIYH